MEVVWKDIPRLPGYQASSEGNIRGPDGVVRKLQSHNSGYPNLVITFAAHRLVCEAFHGEPPTKGAMALHGPDFTRSNIKPDNLRWGTHAENVADGKSNHNKATPKGEAHGRALITEEIVRESRKRFASGEQIKPLWRELGMPLGIEYQAFYKAVKGITWKEIK